MKSKKIKKKIAKLQAKLSKQLYKEQFEVQAKDKCPSCSSKDWSHDDDLITCNHCNIQFNLHTEENPPFDLGYIPGWD